MEGPQLAASWSGVQGTSETCCWALKWGWSHEALNMWSLCELRVVRVRVGWPVGCPARAGVGVGRQEAACPDCMGMDLLPHTPQQSCEHTSLYWGLVIW